MERYVIRIKKTLTEAKDCMRQGIEIDGRYYSIEEGDKVPSKKVRKKAHEDLKEITKEERVPSIVTLETTFTGDIELE